MQQIGLPVRWPTASCFGGPDLKTLYVTNLRTGRQPDQLAALPDADTLVYVDMQTNGLAKAMASRIIVDD